MYCIVCTNPCQIYSQLFVRPNQTYLFHFHFCFDILNRLTTSRDQMLACELFTEKKLSDSKLIQSVFVSF